ncbi:MAG: hypothetical protein PVJ09_01770 [Candidatus Woesebacteria bacterium]|jgi:hypothetical protein
MKDRFLKTDADSLRADISGPNEQADGQVNIWDYSLLVREWTE